MNIDFFTLLAIFFVGLIACGTIVVSKRISEKMKLLLYAGISLFLLGSLKIYLGDQADEIIAGVAHEYMIGMAMVLITLFVGLSDSFHMDVKSNMLWLMIAVGGPLAGAFLTSMSLYPLGIALLPVIYKVHRENWLAILAIFFMVCCNITSIGVPQGDLPAAQFGVDINEAAPYIAKYLSPEDFSYDYLWSLYRVFIAFAWVTYVAILHLLGVRVSSVNFRTLPRVHSWARFSLGASLVAALVYAILNLHGTIFALFLLAFCAGAYLFMRFGGYGDKKMHEVHETVLETLVVFLPFYALSALAIGMASVGDLGTVGTTVATVFTTNGADNLPAYNSYKQTGFNISLLFGLWGVLFPSMVYGFGTIIGHAAQILMFIVKLPKEVKLDRITTKKEEVGKILIYWTRGALLLIPLPLTWSVVFALSYALTGAFPVSVQVFAGVLSSLLTVGVFAAYRRYQMSRGKSYFLGATK